LTAQSAAKPAGADPMNRSVANPVKRQFLNATSNFLTGGGELSPPFFDFRRTS
jgi:hypothetical protein